MLARSKRRNEAPGPGQSGYRAHEAGRYINYAHTTDINKTDGAGSVLERSELDEFFHLAELANRDFTTERGRERAMVISAPGENGEAAAAAARMSAEETARARDEAETLHRDALSVPRRPAWTHDTTAKLENMDIHVDRWPWEDCGGCVDGLDKHDFTNYAESLG